MEMLAVKECRLAEMQDAIVHSSQALVDVTRLVWATALMSLATVILAVAAIVS